MKKKKLGIITRISSGDWNHSFCLQQQRQCYIRKER